MNHSLLINEEVGFRNLEKITKEKKTCEIYFHLDMDGVTSSLALKQFLLTYYDIKLKDVHVIQYGGLEFAVNKSDQSPDNISVLVDFAHISGSLKLHIVTDHHQSQSGADKTKQSTYFKPARSNTETLSSEVSYNDIFTHTDLKLIQTVDSANFIKMEITPDDVQNSIFKINRNMSSERNRFMMGFVVNRLLLAYKNKLISVVSLNGKNTHIKRNLLECLVLDSNPSLYSLFINLQHYIKKAKVHDKYGKLATPEQIKKNLTDYILKMKEYKYYEDEFGKPKEYDSSDNKQKNIGKIKSGTNFDPEYKIFIQYDAGNMYKPGSYDRYVPFKNNPDTSYFVMVWSMGLIQVTCNPFKKNEIDSIDLGLLSKEMLLKHKDNLSRFKIPLNCIKEEYETSQDWEKMKKLEGENYEGIGFRYSDLKTFYGDVIKDYYGRPVDIDSVPEIKEKMDKVYENMTDSDKNLLNRYVISLWDIIIKNSGGHKNITNINGISMAKYDMFSISEYYKMDRYTDILKKMGRDMVDLLKVKINEFKKTGTIKYNIDDNIELSGGVMNESQKLTGEIYNTRKRRGRKGDTISSIFKIKTYTKLPKGIRVPVDSPDICVESWSVWKNK